jgi:pseudaminic acid biosynthesis-associated methylase
LENGGGNAMNEWEGKFGNDYTERNTPDVGVRYRVFKKILDGLGLFSIVEFGCNKGVNMFALQVLHPEADIQGLEINKKILKQGVQPFQLIKELPKYPVDLVFTCGVLIHVPPEDLIDTMEDIIGASNEYVLAIEYYAPKETEIIYRGKKNMLWKRDYGKLYKILGLKLVKSGNCPEIDHSKYWLFKKEEL